MSDFTLEELEAEAKRRTNQTGSSNKSEDSLDSTQAARAFAYGAASAGIDITTLPFLPGDIVKEVLGSTEPGAAETAKKVFKQRKESDFPGYERFFRFGEGAAPGAAFGFAAGGPVGSVVGAFGGGVTNVVAKEVFPSSPVGQTLIQLLAPSGAASLRARSISVPQAKPPVVDQDTGISMTAGQRTGSPELLAEEQRVAQTLRGAPVAQQFSITQAQEVEDFFSKIQKFKQTPSLSPASIVEGIVGEYDKFNKTLINKFKAQNTANFNAAKKQAGNAEIIPTTNVQQKIDSLIAQYDNPEVPGMQAIANSLRKIKDELTTTTKTGGMLVDEAGRPLTPVQTSTTANNITIDRLQQNLSAWGDAAYKGTFTSPGRNVSEFADASPGMVKGVARQILGAFKDDLAAAASSNVRGADLLQQARQAYSQNLDILNEFAARPLSKYFDVASPSALVPEKVISKFVKLEPSQKAEVASVIQSTRPDIWESLRQQGLNNILDKAKVKGAAANEPRFDLKKFSTSLGELNDADVKWLFPSKTEENQFKAVFKQLKSINQKGSFLDPSKAEVTQALRAMQEGGGAIAGARAKYGLQFLIDATRSVIGTADEKKLAYLMFTPNGRQLIMEASKPNPNLSKLSKGVDGLLTGTASAAITAKEVQEPTERLGMSAEDQSSFFSLEQLEEEAKARGLE